MGTVSPPYPQEYVKYVQYTQYFDPYILAEEFLGCMTLMISTDQSTHVLQVFVLCFGSFARIHSVYSYWSMDAAAMYEICCGKVLATRECRYNGNKDMGALGKTS